MSSLLSPMRLLSPTALLGEGVIVVPPPPEDPAVPPNATGGPKDVTIRALQLDGTWTVIGGDNARGIYPENVSLEADTWGSSRASFNLRRDPTAFFPDIGAYTPIEVDVGSKLVWSGRVTETPSQVAQRQINVQCEGWQYHLDDDLYQRTYVHTALNDWRDCRAFLGENLSLYTTAGSVTTGEGAITMGWPNGSILPLAAQVGVKLDMGENQSAESVVVTFQGITGAANSGALVHIRGSDGEADYNPAPGYWENQGFPFALSVIGTNLSANTVTFVKPRRYITIFLYIPAAVTLTGDVMLQVRTASVFADDAYRSSLYSALKAPQVINDALDRATLLLSSDRSGIDPTGAISTPIPSLVLGQPQTARQTWSAVNAFHDWTSKIDVQRRPVFAAKPSRPLFEIGAWSAVDDSDASNNSGEDIYNRTLVTGQSPDGHSLVDDVYTTGQVDRLGMAQPANPTAATDTSNWSTAPGNLVRVTSVFGVSTTAFALRDTAADNRVETRSSSVSQTLVPGFRYGVSLRIRIGSGVAIGDITRVVIEVLVGPDTVAAYDVADPFVRDFQDWRTVNLSWIQQAPGSSYSLMIQAQTRDIMDTSTDIMFFQGIEFGRIVPTLVDRWGFRRAKTLPINNPLPPDKVASTLIGQTWLDGHRTMPFRGSVSLTGGAALRDITTGSDVGLETLLLNTGELMRFSDRTDPDTGGHSRDGRIAAVTYTPATDSASVTIDSSRTSFEALLSRLSVIQGG